MKSYDENPHVEPKCSNYIRTLTIRRFEFTNCIYFSRFNPCHLSTSNPPIVGIQIAAEIKVIQCHSNDMCQNLKNKWPLVEKNTNWATKFFFLLTPSLAPLVHNKNVIINEALSRLSRSFNSYIKCVMLCKRQLHVFWISGALMGKSYQTQGAFCCHNNFFKTFFFLNLILLLLHYFCF